MNSKKDQIPSQVVTSHIILCIHAECRKMVFHVIRNCTVYDLLEISSSSELCVQL